MKKPNIVGSFSLIRNEARNHISNSQAKVHHGAALGGFKPEETLEIIIPFLGLRIRHLFFTTTYSYVFIGSNYPALDPNFRWLNPGGCWFRFSISK
jgi:hypothetical protein